MTPDSLKDLAFSIARAGATAAQAAHDARQPEIDRLKAKLAKYEAALEECLEYFEDNADVVDGDYGQPAPDKVMRLQQMVEQTLGRGGY